jgi:hypothetical protein
VLGQSKSARRLAFATVLAPLSRGQSTPPQPKITGVLTILSPKQGVIPEQIMKIMPAEIRATVPLYLDGKIQQWFMRGDRRGAIFIMNCKDVAEARALIEGLPLSQANLVDGQYIAVGPLFAARDCYEIARPISELGHRRHSTAMTELRTPKP